jgi:hypothetical protein
MKPEKLRFQLQPATADEVQPPAIAGTEAEPEPEAAES